MCLPSYDTSNGFERGFRITQKNLSLKFIRRFLLGKQKIHHLSKLAKKHEGSLFCSSMSLYRKLILKNSKTIIIPRTNSE